MDSSTAVTDDTRKSDAATANKLAQFDEPDLHPLGHRVIDACFNNAPVETYNELMRNGQVETLVEV